MLLSAIGVVLAVETESACEVEAGKELPVTGDEEVADEVEFCA